MEELCDKYEYGPYSLEITDKYGNVVWTVTIVSDSYIPDDEQICKQLILHSNTMRRTF